MQREDSFAEKDKDFGVSSFSRLLVSDFTSDSETYAYPTGYTTLGLWYNKSILKAAKIKSVPSGTAAVSKLACKLTNDTTHVYGMSLSPDAYHFFAFLPAFGASVLNGKGAPAINSKQTTSALAWYAGMVKSGCAETPRQVDRTQGSLRQSARR